MKKIKCPLQIVFIALFSFILFSCVTVRNSMQNVQLGMHRQEVVNILGKDFQVVSLVQTDQGGLEILRYADYTPEAGVTGYYLLHFLKGKLVEMYRENLDTRPVYPDRPGRPHRY